MSSHSMRRSQSHQPEEREASLQHPSSAGPHITRRPHYSSQSSESPVGWPSNNYGTLSHSASGRVVNPAPNNIPVSEQSVLPSMSGPTSSRTLPAGVSTLPRNGTLSRIPYSENRMPPSHYRTLPQNSFVNTPTLNSNKNAVAKGVGGMHGYHTMRMNSSPLPSTSLREDYRSDNLYSPISNTIAASKGTIDPGSPQLTYVKGYVPCIVTLLDGTDHTVQMKRSAKGIDLFEEVCTHLDVKEREYFALAYINSDKIWNWLRLDKKISNYLTKAPWLFDFRVRFYPPEPRELQDDLTRYLLCLQIRQDVYCKKLPVSYFALVVMNGYIVQSEVGNFDTGLHANGEYIWEMLLLPPVLHTNELMLNVTELHKHLRGLLPEQADIHFLEIAKKLSLYGIEFHSVKDLNHVEVNIGLNHLGILIYMGRLRINRFFWPKIIKVSYHRNMFRIFLRPSVTERQMKFIEFRCENTKRTRRLWKACVEFHTFFRLRNSTSPGKRSVLPSGLLSRQYRRSLTTLSYPSTRQWPTSDTEGVDEAGTLRNRQPLINRRHANRKSWHAKDSHSQPNNAASQPGQLSGLEAWDYVDALSPTNSIRGETLPRPKLVTSHALRQPPPGGSRIIRPTVRPGVSETEASSPPMGGSVPSILDEPHFKSDHEKKMPTPVTVPSKTNFHESPYATVKGFNRPQLPGPQWRLSHVDATPVLMVDRQDGLNVRDDGLSVSPQGCRSNWGVSQYGKYYYEMRVIQHQTDQRYSPPCVRVGWSTISSSLLVGEGKGSFGYGASRLNKPKTAPTDHYSFRVTEGEGHSDGEALAYGDVIGCYLDLNVGRVSWTRNGIRLSSGFPIPPGLLKEAFFPACTLRNCTLEAHFDEKSLLYRPGEEWLPLPKAPMNVLVPNKKHGWRLNPADATAGMDLSSDGLVAQAKWNRGWQGVRSNFGIAPHSGRYYFEVTPLEMDSQKESGILLGWSIDTSSLRLGEDANNVGYGGTLHSSHHPESSVSSFGVTSVNDSGFQKSITKETMARTQVIPFRSGDVIGCCLDYNRWTINWYVNGELVQTNVTIQSRLRYQPLFPTITLKNATLECNFGDQPFRYHRQDHGSTPVCTTSLEHIRYHPSIQNDVKKLYETQVTSPSSWNEGGTIKTATSRLDNPKSVLSSGTSIWSPPQTSMTNTMSSNYTYEARNLSKSSSMADNKSQPSYHHESGISIGDTSLSEESHYPTATPITKEYTTVLEGEPVVEKESFIAEDGTRMTRTVKRTRIITKTASATMYPPTGAEPLVLRSVTPTTTINTVKTIQLNNLSAVTTSASSTSLSYNSSSAITAVQTSSNTTSNYLHPNYNSTHQSYIQRSPSPQHRQQSPQPNQMGAYGVATLSSSPLGVSPSQSPGVGHNHHHHHQHQLSTPATVIEQGHSPILHHQHQHRHYHQQHQHQHHLTSTSSRSTSTICLHRDDSSMCGSTTCNSSCCAAGTCSTTPGVGCSHGIPTMVTKTSYYCYHPSPNESKEEAMARLTQAIQLAESSSSQGNEVTTEINLLGSLPSGKVTSGTPVLTAIPHYSNSPESEPSRFRQTYSK